MKRILQIDGGGIMGVIPTMVLARLEEEIEKRYNRSLHESFDLIIGSSTGAIIGGGIAAGVRARTLADMYINDGPSLFKKKSMIKPVNWLRNRYDRSHFLEVIKSIETLPGSEKTIENFSLSDLQTRFIATAFNLCSGRTHFIKSWQDKDSSINLVDLISWSALSAMFYFGKINVPDFTWYRYDAECREMEPVQGAVFHDGGQGSYNNTIDIVLSEILAQGWDKKEKVYILSLGTGVSDETISYNRAKGIDFIGQILRFPFQARNESTRNQVLTGRFVSENNKRITFKRINRFVPKKENGLDRVEYTDRFIAYGKELAEQFGEADFRAFK